MSGTYHLPSLVELSLLRVSRQPLPLAELQVLPPHLKDGLRVLLLKRGLASPQIFSTLLHSKVTEVDLSDSDIQPQHIKEVTSCSAVTSLNLNRTPPAVRVTGTLTVPGGECDPHTEALLSQLVGSLKKLETLYIRYCPSMTDKVLANLSYPSSITNLDLSYCQGIGDEGIANLAANCPKLLSLAIARTGVSDAGISLFSVSECKLTELNISSCKLITDQGIETLLTGQRLLTILLFHGCPLVTEQSRLLLHQAMTRQIARGRAPRQISWTVY